MNFHQIQLLEMNWKINSFEITNCNERFTFWMHLEILSEIISLSFADTIPSILHLYNNYDVYKLSILFVH